MLLLAGALLLGVLVVHNQAAPPQPEPADPFERAVAVVRPSVLAVGSYDAKDQPSIRYFGTGFVVADGHSAVTNAHVVQGIRAADRLDRLRVYFPDDQVQGANRGRQAKVLAEDTVHDVALLSFDGPPAAALELVDRAPAQGHAVGVLGYPIGTILGLVPAAHHGVVSAVVPAVLPVPTGTQLTPELVAALRNPYKLYQLDLTVFPGNSGSPLFDARSGQVLGIINKTLARRTREHMLENPTGVAYAVPVRWVQILINDNLRTDDSRR
ncbi:MAG: serine protease [Phycisphaeraceae bacterium]